MRDPSDSTYLNNAGLSQTFIVDLTGLEPTTS